MMEITARVFDNGKLIGYQVTDGSATKLIDLNTTIFLAKTGKINNVKATQDGITGINGFELRKLPQIDKPASNNASKKHPQAPMREFTDGEKEAAVGRLSKKVKLPNNKDAIYSLMRRVLYDEIDKGEVDPNTLSTLSPYIEILNELTDKNGDTAGFQIGYTGKQPLQIRRLERYEEEISIPYGSTKRIDRYKESDIVLTMNYGDTQYLNLKEFDQLSIRPEVSYTFSNGTLLPPFIAPYRRLLTSKEYVIVLNGYSELNQISIFDAVDNNTINKFFTTNTKDSTLTIKDISASYINKMLAEQGIGGDTTSQQNSQAPKKSKEELKKALKEQGLFNGFKR